MRKLLLFVFLFMLSLWAKTQVIDQHWVETFHWHGFGSQYTEQFQVFGKKWRVRYRALNQGPLSVILHEEQIDRAVSVTSRKGGRANGYKQYNYSPGNKCLFIIGSMGGWKVSIEEYVDSVQEWKHLKYLKDKAALESKAAWAGQTAREFIYEAEESWQLQFEHLTDGLMQIQVFNENEDMLFDSLTNKPGSKGKGWIYNQGKYLIKVGTSDVAWRINAYIESKQ